MHPFLKSSVGTIECVYRIGDLKFFNDHMLGGQAVFPAAGYVETFLDGVKKVDAIANWIVSDINFLVPLSFSPELELRLCIHWDGALAKLEISARNSGDEWKVFSTAEARRSPDSNSRLESADLAAVRSRLDSYSKESFYETFHRETALRYGPAFQAVENYWIGPGEFVSRIVLPSTLVAGEFSLHPSITDAVFQSLGGKYSIGTLKFETIVPIAVGEMRVWQTGLTEVFMHGKARTIGDSIRTVAADLKLYDRQGIVVGEINGLVLRAPKQNGKQDAKSSDAVAVPKIDAYREALIPLGVSSKLSTKSPVWVVFASSEVNSERYIEYLRSNHKTVVSVSLGSGFQMLSDREYVADSSQEASYDKILEKILQSKIGTDFEIIYFAPYEGFESRQAVQLHTMVGCRQLMFLTRAIGRLGDAGNTKLTVVTKSESVVHASVVGLARVIASEMPELKCLRIEYDNLNYEPGILSDAVLSRSASEILATSAGLSKRQLQKFPVSDENRIRVIEHATYIVTGGLGALGKVFCKWLLTEGAGRVVLTGRRQLSAEDQRVVASLDQSGERVQYVKVDVSDLGGFRSLVEKIAASAFPLKGIIHSAGTIEDSLIVNMPWESFERVCDSKVIGAINIRDAVSNLNLDFVALFSSIASIVGSKGQGNYSAANRFMDKLAIQMNAKGKTVWTSFNWGPWEEHGMATTEGVVKTLKRVGISFIADRDGAKFFSNCLGLGGSVMACEVNWSLFAKHHEWGMDYVDIGNLTGEVSKNTDATLPLEVRAAISVVPQRESIETKPDCAANKSGIEATIKRELTRIMEFREGDEIDVDRPLVDMGMDSLMSLELRKSLSKHFNVSLPSTLIFEYPTIQKLSLHLASLVTKDVPVEVKSASTVSEKLDGRDAGPSNVPEPTTIEPAPSKVSPDVLSFLRNEAARIMEFENGEAIDPERPLVDMGFDSLMSVELRKAIAVKFSIKVPTTLVFEYPTLSKIAGYLASQVNVAA